MKDFVKLNQTFFCLSLGMSGSLWAETASIFFISDVVNVDVDDDDDDDDDKDDCCVDCDYVALVMMIMVIKMFPMDKS